MRGPRNRAHWTVGMRNSMVQLQGCGASPKRPLCPDSDQYSQRGEFTPCLDCHIAVRTRRIERDFVADAPSLPITAIEIVRQYRHERVEHGLKHGYAPLSWR